MKYKIEVLSPIHVGSGKTYKPIDYIEKKEEVLIFDEKDVIENIDSAYVLDSELLKSISYAGSRREYYKNLDYFINKGIINKKVLDKVKITAKNRVNDLKAKEIQGTMRNVVGPFIPGGTIKGIIRTAIFYDYVKSKGIKYIKRAISNLRKNKKTTIEDLIIGGGKKAIDKDPFRFLSVKDVNMKEDKVSIYQESLFNIDTRPFPGNVVETISEGVETEEFKINITIKNDLVKKLGMDEEIASYFNEEKILEVLYRFSEDILDEEINYFTRYSYKLFNNKEILRELGRYKKLNSKDSPVLRIGKGTGYISHTVGLAVKKLDPVYYGGEFMSYVKPPKRSKRYGFPKTRKFVGEIVSPKLLGFAVLRKVD